MSNADARERLARGLADRYRLERELGRGGMATVHLARDLKHDRLVALKVLHPDLAATLGPERFQREIRFAARLQHPHVLTVLDSGEAAGQLWFTMPYVEGESLRERLNRERQLPIDDALRIAREAAQALHYAHEHGVLHRDVKPENILLTTDGNTLVADFGVARALAGDESLTQTGLAVGTPAYMSPEQAAGERTIDARSDVYALGCVLYEMLAGEPPFTGPTAQAVIAKRFNTPVTPVRVTRPEVPDEVDQATLRALARTPADRFGTAADFSQSLRLGSATPTATRITPTSPVSPRRRVGVLIGLGLLLMAGVGAAWLRTRAPTAVSTDSSAFAVLPFRAVGPGLELWREGLVDLLAINLDGAGGLRAISPRTVLSRWHQDIGGGEADEEQTLAVARGVGARYALTGSIIGSGSSLRLTAELRDLQANRLAGRAQTEGPGDSVPAMVDRLTLQLLSAGLPAAGRGSVSSDLGGVTTRSLPALKHFLVGEQLFRGGLADSALAEYRAAVAADSDFALGAYRLVVTKAWTYSPHYVNNYPADDLPRLLRLADRLPPREAAVTAATPLLVRAEPAALPMLARIVDQHPGDAEAWFQYGDALFHLGGAAGEPRQKFRDALRRATELDPGLAFAYVHLAEDAFDRGDRAEVARIVDALQRTDAESPKTTGLALAEQEVWGDDAARARVRAALDTASPDALLAAKHALDLTPDLLSPTLLFARALADQPRYSNNDRANGYGGMSYALRAVGRLREARGATDSALTLNGYGPWVGVFDAAVDLWMHLQGVGDSARAEATYARLATHDSLRVFELQVPQLMGLYASTRGRSREADEWIAVLERRASGMKDSAQADLLRTDVGVVKAFAAEARGDRRAVLPALRAAAARYPLAEGIPESGFLRLELARRLLAEGNYRDAERYLGSFDIGTYHFWLIPSVVELYRAQAKEGLGEADRAREHYGNVVRWLGDCDPELVPVRERAREALARLSAEPAERT